MPQGLNDHEAGKIAGVSHQAIGNARRGGKIDTMEDGTIAVAALEKWSAGRRTPRGGNHRQLAEPPLPSSSASSVDGDGARKARAALEVTLSPGGLYADRQAAELARDSYAARLKQLEFEERSRRMFGGDVIERHISAGTTKVRTAFLAMPSAIAPVLARLKTPAEVEDALRSFIIEVLEELAAHFAAGLG